MTEHKHEHKKEQDNPTRIELDAPIAPTSTVAPEHQESYHKIVSHAADYESVLHHLIPGQNAHKDKAIASIHESVHHAKAALSGGVGKA